ncbi:DUF2797 domain-containing protein [Candidatus Gracilibacteria bacterium]|nr:DUF2797 domain-containing protein [Candidatus Gracilibacteria bacterium]
MKVLVYDFRWIDERTTEFQASTENKFGRKALKIGDSLSLEICSDVMCVGSRIDDIWSPCPNKTKGKAKCDICKMRERNFIFTAFDGFDRSNVTELDLEQISGSHVVYLVLFDTNLLKIGVTQVSRKILRQIEQGSHFTLFVAQTPDGISARQIETLIRKDGLVDKITSSQKKDFLCPALTEIEGEKILLDVFAKHRKALDEYPHLQDFLLKNPEFRSWESIYNTKDIGKNPKSFHSVQLKNGESVAGTILAIKGPFLVVETPDELVALCAKDLIGHEIDFGTRAPGLSVHTALQNSLF